MTKEKLPKRVLIFTPPIASTSILGDVELRDALNKDMDVYTILNGSFLLYVGEDLKWTDPDGNPNTAFLHGINTGEYINLSLAQQVGFINPLINALQNDPDKWVEQMKKDKILDSLVPVWYDMPYEQYAERYGNPYAVTQERYEMLSSACYKAYSNLKERLFKH